MRKQWILIALVIFSFLIPTSLAYGPLVPATVYVDDNYNSGTPGWGVNHFNNIQSGVNAVAVDGNVIVYAGTYDSITVNKRIILEGQSRTYVIIDGSGSGTVVTLASDNINMSGFTIMNADTGIDLLSDYNIITLCRVENTNTGFLFEASDGNTIFYNDVVDNTYGMDLFDYENNDNFVYHNNFLNCTAIDDWGFGMSTNRWNGSYPSGGNYWYDHVNFTDVKHGPNQDILGADNITDNPYTCGRTGIDYYPFTSWIYPPTESPPVLSDIDPADDTMFASKTQLTVSVKITDTRTFDWTIEGEYINSASGTSDTTGTKTATLKILPYFTNIVWYVNVTDSIFSVSEVYMFSTISSYGGTSLQETIDNAPSGTDLTVPYGTYSENLQIDKPFTLRGIDPDTTIIDAGSGNGITINSDEVTIKDFTIKDANSGIFVNYSEYATIGGSGNVFTDNVYAIKLVYSNFVIIEGDKFQRNTYGIYLDHSDQNTIDNNNLSGIFGRIDGNFYPIYLVASDKNTISDNTIHYNNNTAISLSQSTENKITNNDIWRNDNANPVIFVRGIHLSASSHYNTISKNIISENGDDGIQISDSIGTTIVDNDVYENANFGILMFFGTDNSSIGRNTVHSNGGYGISLWSSNDDKVFRNNISGNEHGGIYIYYESMRNKIYENDIIGYSYDYGLPEYQPLGIYIRESYDHVNHPPIVIDSMYNEVFHNSFYNNHNYEIKDETPNGTNTWDDGYPSGGNYFEVFHNDSQGAYDDYRGKLQTALGSDGIVDTPYHGEVNATDYYPLRSPYRIIKLASLDFTWSPLYPKPRETVTFTALTEKDVVDWQWEFGDVTMGAGKTTTKTYGKAGYYVISLKVTYNGGYRDTLIKRILIMPKGPFIPDLQPPKYPGYTIPEMYDLLHATNLTASKSKVKVMVIDSGILPKTYNGIDLSTIQMKHATGWSDGLDANGHGCIDGNSYIFAQNNLLKIKDFYENLNLSSINTNAGLTKYINTTTLSVTNDGMILDDDIEAVHKVWVDDAIKITTLWNKTLLLTPWHPTPTIVDDKIIWKRADQITTDDYIVSSMIPGDFGKYQETIISKRVKPGASEIITQKMTLDEDLAWLIGFTIGDGTVRNREVILTDEKNETLEKARDVAIRHGFTVGHGIQSTPKKQNGFSLSIYSGFDKLFDAIGYDNGTKNIPSVIFKSPISVRESFVAGLFDAEGYVWESNGIRQRYSLGEIRVIVSVREELCKQLVVILDGLGLPSSYEKILSEGYGDSPNNNTLFAVTVKQKWNLINFVDRLGEYIISFKKDVICRNINSNPITKREVILLNDCVGLKVRKIEKIPVNDYFYDLSTAKYNNYYASGFIVHNTWTNYAVSYILKSKLPNSEQISYRIFGADGQSTNDMLLQALDDAKRMGVDVVSISAGAIGNPNDQFCRKVQELAGEGIIVVCAVGNFGPYTSTVLSPGCSLYSLSVAGSDPQWYGDTMTPERKAGVLNLADDEICEFSSRGPVPNVYPKPDVTAPAESITGPWASNGLIVERTVSGTSMATPLVSGAIAVIIGQNKDLMEQVKTARFWDKGAVVVALQESIRESCYVKGGVNDWGAGIVQFDKVSKIYAGKLQGLLVMSYITMFLPIILLIILIVSIYLIRRGTKRKASWSNKKRKSTWGKTIRRAKSHWNGW